MQFSRITIALPRNFFCFISSSSAIAICPLTMATGEGSSIVSTADKLKEVLKVVCDIEEALR